VEIEIGFEKPEAFGRRDAGGLFFSGQITRNATLPPPYIYVTYSLQGT